MRASGSQRSRRSIRQRRVSIPEAGSALLLIDVINDLAFEGSDVLVAQAEPRCLPSETHLGEAVKRSYTGDSLP
jgi:hypothetical protein